MDPQGCSHHNSICYNHHQLLSCVHYALVDLYNSIDRGGLESKNSFCTLMMSAVTKLNLHLKKMVLLSKNKSYSFVKVNLVHLLLPLKFFILEAHVKIKPVTIWVRNNYIDHFNIGDKMTT